MDETARCGIEVGAAASSLSLDSKLRLLGHDPIFEAGKMPILRCQRRVHAGDERIDAGGQRKIRRRFEGVASRDLFTIR